MASTKLRVGIIGANVTYGWAPRAHLPALLALPDYELTAVCTAHPETAKASAEKFGARLAYSDHTEMLSHPDIDVVAVSVRVPLHHQLTMDALNAGKHVYTEWPLGANLQETEELAALARSKGLHAMVGMQRRYDPIYMRLKELVDEGYVGEVLSCRLTQIGSGVLTRTSDRTWQRDVTLGANTLTISFGHAIDAMCMSVGEFQEVSAVVSTRVKQWHETDTDLMVDVTSPDNILVSGSLTSGAVASAHVASVPWAGSGSRTEVYGREGTLVVVDDTKLLGTKGNGSALEELPIPARLTWVPAGVPKGPPFNVAQMWSRFADAIRNDDRAEPDFDSAVTRHKLLDAIQRASDTGQRQQLV